MRLDQLSFFFLELNEKTHFILLLRLYRCKESRLSHEATFIKCFRCIVRITRQYNNTRSAGLKVMGNMKANQDRGRAFTKTGDL